MSATRERRRFASTHTRGAPAFVGMTVGSARTLASRSGLSIGVVIHRDDDGPWGRVVAQFPAAGTGTRPGARVSVVVAGGPDVQVPDLRGRTEGAALQILRSSGLDAGRRSEHRTDDAQAGHIMRTRPRAGSTVAMGSCVDYVIGHSPWYGGGVERRSP